MTREITDLKKSARTTAAIMRKAAHEELQHTAPLALASHPFPIKPESGRQIVSAFYPYKSEIDTRPLLGKLAGEGWTTCLPIVIGEGLPLEFRRWLPGEPTVPGVWGIPRPPDSAPIMEPDVLIIPMLAFDRSGYRLGYGGGFYDHTLEKLRTRSARKTIIAIGAAYSAQEIPNVPVSAHDQALDYIITEREIIRCK
jgi:5-formyltetrahydrofolate cyclo-ligase